MWSRASTGHAFGGAHLPAICYKRTMIQQPENSIRCNLEVPRAEWATIAGSRGSGRSGQPER